jgi:hypothetical protein
MRLDNTHLILCVALFILGVMYFKNKCKCDHKLLLKLNELWVQHFIYTRLVFVAFFTDSPELETLKNRLIQNQKDIGMLFGKLYGRDTGFKVTKLLLEHINIAVSLLESIRNNDSANKTKALNKFYNNADVIGTAIDKLKGTKGKFKHHMKMHIKLLVDCITSFVNEDYESDLQNYDLYINAGLRMSMDMYN